MNRNLGDLAFVVGDATLHLGDCIEVMRTMPEGSVDSIVTDPPYHLTSPNRPRGAHVTTDRPNTPHGRARIGDRGFMGKLWDGGDIAQRVEMWEQCLRVLKPGGHLLAFSGPRTQHRMVCAIEDAGFEIRDQIIWVYGSGFPKSRNIFKAMNASESLAQFADEWSGWGTALKPAQEPICVARKPFKGSVIDNLLAHGTGAINIDGCRVETDGVEGCELGQLLQLGRWPANLIHDGSEEVIAAFPDAGGKPLSITGAGPSARSINVSGAMERVGEASQDSDNSGAVGFEMKPGVRRLDTGSAARFFYCAKTTRIDRNEGLSDSAGNNHPTVKPTKLMAYLCRLVTPPGGVVLDPFMGSGSTGKGAVKEGFEFIGIDMMPEHVEIARARIGHACELPNQVKKFA